MRVRAKLASDSSRDFTVTITATVEDFQALLQQLEELRKNTYIGWPASGLYDCVHKVLTDLERTYEAHSDKGGPV
jgi:hypothetical protein